MEFHRDRCEGAFGGGNKRAYFLLQRAPHICFEAILRPITCPATFLGLVFELSEFSVISVRDSRGDTR